MSQRTKSFSTSLYEVVYEVEEKDNGIRLDQFLAPFFSSFSREQIKKKIQRGDVTILNRHHPNKASIKVYHREKIRVQTKREDRIVEKWNGIEIQEADPTIIFEDDDLLIINKPPYMATHPTGRYLFYTATTYFEEKLNHRMHSIHRLDRETSGCLILGKNPKISQVYMDHFENNNISKAYFFIAHKNQENPDSFYVNKRLGEIQDFAPRLYAHCFDEDSKEGKHAQTFFMHLYTEDDYSFYLAYPITGRPHQIRSHANNQGLPLLGDKLYNDPEIFMRFQSQKETQEDINFLQISRQALHALAIKIPYKNSDSSKNEKIISSQLPHDFQNWIKNNLSEEAQKYTQANYLKEKVIEGFKRIQHQKENANRQ